MKSKRCESSCCRKVASSSQWEKVSWCSLLVATPTTWSKNLAMTISGGVDRKSQPNSDDDIDMVDSTDVSNWDEELAIGSVKVGEDLEGKMTQLICFSAPTKFITHTNNSSGTLYPLIVLKIAVSTPDERTYKWSWYSRAVRETVAHVFYWMYRLWVMLLCFLMTALKSPWITDYLWGAK